MYKSLGISPKVMRPFVLSLLAGAVLFLVGQVEEAKGVLAAAAMSLIAGATAPVGEVFAVDPDPELGVSDSDLEALASMAEKELSE